MKSVWVFMRGEHCEGGHILGIYTSEMKAMKALHKEAKNPKRAFADRCSWNEDKTGFDAGCDWYQVREIEITK